MSVDGQNGQNGMEYELAEKTTGNPVRSNRETTDDPTRQRMSMDEIEALKKEGTGAGRDLITRILVSHSALDQKTAFSLAKYTLRKTRKYLRRFTVLPLDVPLLANWIMSEKEPQKILELREEMLALVGSWANVHYSCDHAPFGSGVDRLRDAGEGRLLVVDETGGLIVAALAERMGILYPAEEEEEEEQPEKDSQPTRDETDLNVDGSETATEPFETILQQRHRAPTTTPAKNNTLTLIHSNAQPNMSLLNYFLYDSANPSPTHPLYRHFKTLSWLQLLYPDEDIGYTEPEFVEREVLMTWKSGKKGTYHRKRRRWERIKSIVDETRAGGFEGLVVASVMSSIAILQNTVHLLRGGAQIVVYSPTIEPLAELADCYSTARRTAFITDPPDLSDMPTEDFPLDPTLLLGPTIQTARVRDWQVLPGRTHPLMTGRGGSEGYLFTATRVLPAEGKVEARGKFKRRKVDKAIVADNSMEDSS